MMFRNEPEVLIFTEEEILEAVDRYMDWFGPTTDMDEVVAEMCVWSPALLIMGAALEKYGNNGIGTYVSEGGAQLGVLSRNKFPHGSGASPQATRTDTYIPEEWWD